MKIVVMTVDTAVLKVAKDAVIAARYAPNLAASFLSVVSVWEIRLFVCLSFVVSLCPVV